MHISTRDEALLHCRKSRGTTSSMSALERKPEVPASTPDEDLGTSSDCRGIPRGPSGLAWSPDLPEAPRVSPRDRCRNLRGTPPQLDKNQEVLPST